VADPPGRGGAGDVGRLFLRLGLTAFGGPAAHIGIIHHEVVRRRHWMTDAEFADLLGASNLIPGPTSTELALHVGHRRAGWPGFVVVAVAWILPAVVVSLALAIAYVSAGTLPQTAVILASVAPVVVAIVAHAAIVLGRTVLRTPVAVLTAIAAAAASLAGASEGVILALGAALGLVGGRHRDWPALLAGVGATGLPTVVAGVAAGVLPSVGAVFLAFAKIGALLFGSGYVLIAFLRSDLVAGMGWITEQQLFDAVAVGQVTPGPVSSTATFIGYLVAGVPGAIAATLGIFLPGALLVAISIPILPRIATSRTARVALDGVNAAALGLLLAVTVGLGHAALVDPVSVAVAVLAGGVLLAARVSPAVLVLAAAGIGIVRALGA
jgi:chromate transporter